MKKYTIVNASKSILDKDDLLDGMQATFEIIDKYVDDTLDNTDMETFNAMMDIAKGCNDFIGHYKTDTYLRYSNNDFIK